MCLNKPAAMRTSNLEQIPAAFGFDRVHVFSVIVSYHDLTDN